ncbi:MAG: VCBS repeat-containing protein [Planctomycetes bacterium]|nr:VCBS repeat-containing protein [Planctomycetota bacterium]
MLRAGLVLLLASSAVGQAQFEVLGRRHLPDVPGYAIAIADFDADSDADILLRSGEILRNDGHARFTSIGSLPHEAELVAVADFDGDTDLDIVVATPQLAFFEQTGSLTFQDTTSSRFASMPGGFIDGILVGDVDGDFDPDLVVEGRALDPVVMFNDGNGSFSLLAAPTIDTTSLKTRTSSLADVDGDGRPDLIRFANPAAPGDRAVWLNDGSGRFSLHWQFPPSITQALPVDFDGDLDVDLIAANVATPHTSLWRNDGGATFTEDLGAFPDPGTPTSNRMVVLDANGDSRIDLFVAPNVMYRARAGGFTDPFVLSGVETTTNLPSRSADFDQDGLPDLLLHSSALHLNVTSDVSDIAFDDVSTRSTALYGAVAAGDVDHDGDMDVLRSDGSLLI